MPWHGMRCDALLLCVVVCWCDARSRRTSICGMLLSRRMQHDDTQQHWMESHRHRHRHRHRRSHSHSHRHSHSHSSACHEQLARERTCRHAETHPPVFVLDSSTASRAPVCVSSLPCRCIPYANISSLVVRSTSRPCMHAIRIRDESCCMRCAELGQVDVCVMSRGHTAPCVSSLTRAACMERGGEHVTTKQRHLCWIGSNRQTERNGTRHEDVCVTMCVCVCVSSTDNVPRGIDTMRDIRMSHRLATMLCHRLSRHHLQKHVVRDAIPVRRGVIPDVASDTTLTRDDQQQDDGMQPHATQTKHATIPHTHPRHITPHCVCHITVLAPRTHAIHVCQASSSHLHVAAM